MFTQIIKGCLNAPRTVVLILILLLAAGAIAYLEIPKESEPDIDIPTIFVTMVHEGISPEDAERLLVRPMEQELRGIDGLDQIESAAHEGYASVTLEFEAGFDPDTALADVREQVDIAKAELPQETEEPAVNEINLSLFPVITVALYGNIPERQLLATARDLRDKIEGISEVLEVDITGEREELVEVVIDPTILETYGIQQNEVFALVGANNRLIAAGNLDTGAGRFPVKVPGLYEEVEDILSTPLLVRGDRVIEMRDVAQIYKTYKDPNTFARINGQPSLSLEVVKRTGENVIDTVAKTKAIVAEEQRDWPPGLQVSFSGDSSRQINTMLADLQNNVISAVLLVMIVVVLALGWRTGLLVGVAIPGSFLTGLLILHTMGLTMNIVVLFSLILAVGMLVDGAIVVTEFADRKMAEGVHRRAAYRQASLRMAMPIISSTATTLAAFAPLLFWPGIVGEFMKFLPLTLIMTLSASLAMALVFIPVLGSIFGKAGASGGKTLKALAASEKGNVEEIPGLTGRYVKVLKWSLLHPWVIVAVAIASLIGVNTTYQVLGKGVEFFPSVEPEQAALYVRMRGDYSVFEYDQVVREVEQRILSMDQTEFRNVYVRTQARGGGGEGGGGGPEDTHGVIQLEFADWEYRRPADQIIAEIRELARDIPGIIIEQQTEEAGPQTGKDIQLELSSRFPALLEPAIEKVRAKFARVDDLIDINDSRPAPGIEWEVKVDRAQASRFGADIASVGNTVQLATNGLLLDTYRPEDADDEVDIRVRYPLKDRSLTEIENLRVRTNDGLVPIRNFATWEPAPKVGRIQRVDQRRQFTVSANLDPAALDAGVTIDQKVKEIQAWVDSEAGFDRRIIVAFRGEDEEQREAQQFLGNAFLVALFVMGIILVTQFNSFYEAFLILTAVIFSTVGVFIGLLVTHQPFGIVMNGIGVIALAGIVVNNNIVLIDTFDTHVKNGMNVFEAILRTGAQRLRPVLLTTVTTALGLIPMVLQLNVDFINRHISHGAPSTQWWVQLATSVVFGLIFATFLTLILTPVLLRLGTRFLANKGPNPAEQRQLPA